MIHCGALLTACDEPMPSAAPDAGSAKDGSAVFPCMVTAPTACPDPVPHYPDVEPIIRQRCVVCHAENSERWPLTTYKHVADWYDTIRGDLLSCTMPPPAAAIPITPEERLAILTWIRCGYLK